MVKKINSSSESEREEKNAIALRLAAAGPLGVKRFGGGRRLRVDMIFAEQFDAEMEIDKQNSSVAEAAEASGRPSEGKPSASVKTEADADASDDFPAATSKDFDDEVTDEERNFCLQRYTDLNKVKQARMHCTACNKHLGLSAHNVGRLRMHPLLRTLVCVDCLDFYNSGEFLKGEDGSELYCRWCGQGGQVYCCSSCPVVFCENCIKRNFGKSKIDDIESIDDWSCFVCTPKGLWCHRAALWAARRYCILKNKRTLTVTDPGKRLQLQRECQLDESVCCKKKPKTPNQKPKILQPKKVEQKTPGGIAGVKRRSSPIIIKKGIQPIPTGLFFNSQPPPLKKMTIAPEYPPKGILSSALKKMNVRKSQGYNIKFSDSFNGLYPPFGIPIQDSYSNMIENDNLNLSLENLTQGLNMPMNMSESLPTMPNMGPHDNENDNNLVCTPDFPLPIEPLCQVTEADEDCTEVKAPDDDIQCLTPTPRITPKPISSLLANVTNFANLDKFNIVKMTERDVTVNKETGGLKFRVNPSTLSTNKMYQLPDGRVFAVNLNPKMPGGYSATIVSLDSATAAALNRKEPITKAKRGRPYKTKSDPKISLPPPPPPVVRESTRKTYSRGAKSPHNNQMPEKPQTSTSKLDQIPGSIEWYRYNVCDAVDLGNYISKKLNKIKEEPVGNLRSKTIQEMKEVHYSFDQILKIACQRFSEIRSNLNAEFKNWLKEKCSIELFSDEDDDKVEITSGNTLAKRPETTKSLDEPIFIDENSNDSVKNTTQNTNPDEVEIDSMVCDISPGSDDSCHDEDDKIEDDSLSANVLEKSENSKDKSDILENLDADDLGDKTSDEKLNSPSRVDCTDENSKEETDVQHMSTNDSNDLTENVEECSNSVTSPTKNVDNETSLSKNDDNNETSLAKSDNNELSPTKSDNNETSPTKSENNGISLAKSDNNETSTTKSDSNEKSIENNLDEMDFIMENESIENSEDKDSFSQSVENQDNDPLAMNLDDVNIENELENNGLIESSVCKIVSIPDTDNEEALHSGTAIDSNGIDKQTNSSSNNNGDVIMPESPTS